MREVRTHRYPGNDNPPRTVLCTRLGPSDSRLARLESHPGANQPPELFQIDVQRGNGKLEARLQAWGGTMYVCVRVPGHTLT